MSARRPAFVFIFVNVMLDMLGFGIVTPVLPRLIGGLIHAGKIHAGAGRTSQYMGVFIALWALMQFLCSPLLGALSDRFGRRPVILLSAFGLCVDYLIMALAPNVTWLFAGRALSGISSSTMTTANAYVADITPPERRAHAFGLLGGALGIGFVLGPALGGWLGAFGTRVPFFVTAGLALLNALYGLAVLPESLPSAARQHRMPWTQVNPLGSLKLLRTNGLVATLAAMLGLNYLAHEVYPTVLVLYAIYRYGWSVQATGIALAVVAASYGLTMSLLVQPAVRRFGERATLFAGLLVGTAGFALIGLASRGWVFIVAIALQAIWGLALPPAQAILSREIEPDRQGQLQGAVSSLRGLAMIAGPLLFAEVFSASLRRAQPWPGTAWLLASAFVAAALLIGSIRIPTQRINSGGRILTARNPAPVPD